jgi:hypothetical protein
MLVTFKDDDTQVEWRKTIELLPHRGDHVWIDRAPAGTMHRVRNVVHRLIGIDQNITIHVCRVNGWHTATMGASEIMNTKEALAAWSKACTLYNIAYQAHRQAPAERFIETLEAWQQAWRAKVQAEHDYEEAVRCE